MLFIFVAGDIWEQWYDIFVCEYKKEIVIV